MSISPRIPPRKYLVDGITDQFIADLSEATPLRIVSSTSTMQYKGVNKSLPEIARKLNVELVLKGSVLKVNDDFHVTIELLDAEGHHLWAHAYETATSQLFSASDAVTNDVARELAQRLGTSKQPVHGRPISEPAYDLYLRGRFFSEKRTLKDLQEAVRLYKEAIRIEPDFSQAYAALGESFDLMTLHGGPPAQESFPLAKQMAQKAIELDPRCGPAYNVLSDVLFYFDRDWPASQRASQNAITADPNYATAYSWYAQHLTMKGDFPQAEAEIAKAENLDPLSPMIRSVGGGIFYVQHKDDQAMKALDRAMEIDPAFAEAYAFRGKIFEEQGNYEKATTDFEKASALSDRDEGYEALVAHSLALAGKRNAAENRLKTLEASTGERYVQSSYIGMIYCAMGRPEKAMPWFNRAAEFHEDDIMNAGVEPVFDGCRSSPDFKDLLHRLNLR